jgi:hypothetical protein
MSSWPAKMPVLGVWPMATNMPLTARSRVLAASTLRTRTPVTPLSSPSTSSTTWSQISVTLPPGPAFSNSFCCMIFSARSLSRRCTSVTCEAMFDRYSASSTAVLPPPMTATGWPR